MAVVDRRLHGAFRAREVLVVFRGLAISFAGEQRDLAQQLHSDLMRLAIRFSSMSFIKRSCGAEIYQ